jgi:CubicO group peptidase (beta-lactamase class C family)
MANPYQEIPDQIRRFLSDLMPRLPQNGGAIIGIHCPLLPTLPAFYWHGAAGPNISISPDTVYCIGSCTKTFTATLAAWLQTGCSFPLSNTVGNLVGVTGNPNMAAMTLFSLATHTSGMPRTGGPGKRGAQPVFRRKRTTGYARLVELVSCRRDRTDAGLLGVLRCRVRDPGVGYRWCDHDHLPDPVA